jgi:HK97 family phage major capsid protein
MEYEKMTIDELEQRRAQIAEELDAEGADLDALGEEVRTINAELEKRRAAESQRAEIRNAVATGTGETVRKMEEKKMPEIEVRNTSEYINAYAEYIKTGDDKECRALLTENGSGTVAVPELVYDIVKTAWNREGIMSRVRKSYLKGNLKVGFEISGSDAVVHTEGQAVNEETLVLGIVNLVPDSIKKWISVSDEVMDMRGEQFLNYVYDELAYRIAKKAADNLVAKIVAAGTVSTTTSPAVPAITVKTASMGTVADAIAQLSDDAANPVVMMNKLTWSAFKSIQYANGYGADPFEGCEVVFNDTITAYTAATTGVPYMIVGDLEAGALANFPNGEEITFKYDDMTLATSDLVRIIGRQYVAVGVVAPNAFCKVTK